MDWDRFGDDEMVGEITFRGSWADGMHNVCVSVSVSLSVCTWHVANICIHDMLQPRHGPRCARRRVWGLTPRLDLTQWMGFSFSDGIRWRVLVCVGGRDAVCMSVYVIFAHAHSRHAMRVQRMKSIQC